MNKLTKTLLTLPVIALTVVGCVETPNIKTAVVEGVEIDVNCDDKTIYDVQQQKFVTRSEAIDDTDSYGKEIVAGIFDSAYGQACSI